MESHLDAPYIWFGGKSQVADIVWQRIGNVQSYIEPFYGSGAVLLARPHEPKIETINELDPFVVCFWRSVQKEPDKVAEYADWPVTEVDLTARHIWLVEQSAKLQKRMEADPDYYDPKIAGWWVWGINCWIGSGWCSGNGCWVRVKDDEGYWQLVKKDKANLKLVHLSGGGQGVNRQLVRIGDRGVNRQLVHLSGGGQGVNEHREMLIRWMQALSNRLRRVRVCCGDWSRVCTDAVTIHQGTTTVGVMLDPPYGDSRTKDLYAKDSTTVSQTVRDWAVSKGNHKMFRIALCGYDGEYEMPKDWKPYRWKAQGGYENQGTDRTNQHREIIWFSPHCHFEKRGFDLADCEELHADET